MTFQTEPMQKAEKVALKRRREFIDFPYFMSDEGDWQMHHLFPAIMRHAYCSCHRVSWTDFELEPYPETALIRPYLREIANMQGGEIVRVYEQELLTRTPPIWFENPLEGELVIVDIDSAYWQLYAPASVDLDYNGCGHPRQGRVRFLGVDELRPFKVARNALLGTLRSEHRTELVFGELKWVKVAPTLRRPALWAYVQDCLGAIAWEMRRFGARWVNVDGYVFPHRDLAEDAIAWLADRWHLSASVRAEGEGRVTGINTWHLENDDGMIPLDHPQVTRDVPHPVDNMAATPNAEDLRSWFVDAMVYREEMTR